MLLNFKRGQTSVILRVKILDASVTTGAGKTGLAFDTSGLRIATIADNEATTTDYTSAGSTIETISTLGTFATPTATKCRFKEVDSTSHPGVYELQLDNTRFSVANAKSLLITISGVMLTSEYEVVIPLLDVDPYSSTNFGMVQLANGVTHGGSSALLNLSGGDASNPSLLVKNTVAGGIAAQFRSVNGTYDYFYNFADPGHLCAAYTYGQAVVGPYCENRWAYAFHSGSIESVISYSGYSETSLASATTSFSQTFLNGTTASSISYYGSGYAGGSYYNLMGGSSNTVAGVAYGRGYMIEGSNSAGTVAYRTTLGDGSQLIAADFASYVGSTRTQSSIQADIAGRVLGSGSTAFVGIGVQIDNVVVGSYAASQDPATYVLATPSNKLATNATGEVTVGSMATGVIADATFAAPTSDPSGIPSTYLGFLQWLAQRFGINKVVKEDSSGTITVYRNNGTTVRTTNDFQVTAGTETVDAMI